MSVKIRLSRIGRRGKPVFRIVVAPTRSKRNGRNLDILGLYDPQAKPSLSKFDQKKYQEWLKKGASPSEGLRKLLSHEKPA